MSHLHSQWVTDKQKKTVVSKEASFGLKHSKKIKPRGFIQSEIQSFRWVWGHTEDLLGLDD